MPSCTCNVKGVHGFGPHLPGCPMRRYAVRVVFLDGVDRTESAHDTLGAALNRADEYEKELRAANYTRNMVHVGVIDLEDPERGELDEDDQLAGYPDGNGERW